MQKKLFSNIEIHNEERIRNGNISSSAAIVSINGEEVYHGIFGMSDIENAVSLKPNALFRMASMTKPVAAAAIMREYDLGKLDIFDEVSKFIPSFDKMHVGKIIDDKLIDIKQVTNNIRIVDLLTHSSGLASGPVGDRQFQEFIPKTKDTLSTVIPKLGNILLDFEPRTNLAYSGLFAFDTLAYIVEICSGFSFQEYITKYLFSPIGINDITFFPTEDQWNRTVTLYTSTDSGCKREDLGEHIFGNIPMSYTSGGAGLLGSAEDYIIFAQMLAGFGKYRGIRILSEKSVSLMSTSHQPILAPFENYGEVWGLGMRIINNNKNILPKGCFGWSGAYGTHFWIDPVNNLTAVYCSNMTTAGGAGAETAREFERDVMNVINN